MGNGSFLSLISVENTKLWKRLSTKLMLLIIIAIVVGFAGIYKAEQSIITKQENKASYSDSWKQQLKAEDAGLQKQIDTMEKSNVQSEKGNLDAVKMQIAVNKYHIENNIKPEPTKKGFWDYLVNLDFSKFAALLVIIACSGLVAGEFSDNTMKTMITRPFARWQILTSKFIVSFIYAVVVLAVDYLAVLASTALFFGTGGIDKPLLLWIGGNIVNMSGFAGSLFLLGLQFLTVLVYLILTFALSSAFRSRALATGLSIFLMFGGSLSLLLADHFSWGKYVFFADTDFSNFVLMGAPFYGITLGLALVICAVYCVIFLVASYVTFARRDIS